MAWLPLDAVVSIRALRERKVDVFAQYQHVREGESS